MNSHASFATRKNGRPIWKNPAQLALEVLLAAMLCCAGIAAIVAGYSAAGGAEEAYAAARGEKNQQACDHCKAVKAGSAPTGYNAIYGTADKSVYRGGNSISRWIGGTNAWYGGEPLDDDPNDFANPLPYGNVYIDRSKLSWNNPSGFIIDIQDPRFKWVAAGDAPLTDAKENPTASTNDPMGTGHPVSGVSAGIAYVGELKSFHDSIRDKASENGTTNTIKAPAGSYLYRITYLNAATLPNGMRGNLVITMNEVNIESSYTVDAEHPRILTDAGGNTYSYDKALVMLQGPNTLSVIASVKDSEGNSINEDKAIAKTRDEVNGQVEAARKAGANFGAQTSTGYEQVVIEDKEIVHATGAELGFDIEVQDADGNPVAGTISYAAHDLDLPTSQNVWGRSVAGDDKTKFAEGMTIVSGAQSYALTPNYGKADGTLYYQVESGFQGDGWVEKGPFEEQPEHPLLVAGGTGDHANGLRFSSRGIINIRDKDGTFEKAFFQKGDGTTKGQITLLNGGTYIANGKNVIQYKDLNTNLQASYLARLLLVGKVKDEYGNAITSTDPKIMTLQRIYQYVGDASWKSARNDDDTSFDTGFAVLLDATKSSLKWSGSQAHSGSVITNLFDTTIFTYIEQTHGTGGGIYLENYDLASDNCEPIALEGVATMGLGATATVTAVPEEGYRVKQFQIGGSGLSNPASYTVVYDANGNATGISSGDTTTAFNESTATVDGITFEANSDGTIDVTLSNIQNPRHVHVDFDADFYFYKVWKGDAQPTKLNLTAVPYAYVFTDVTLPVPSGIDGEGNQEYTNTKLSINDKEYTAADGTKYVLNENNMLETVEQDAAGYPLATLPYVLRGNSFVATDGTAYPVTVQFGVNLASAAQEFAIDGSDEYTEGGYVTVLGKDNDISPGNIVWKVKYPAQGVDALGWPALPIESEPAAHNWNHVERDYWFVTEEAPGWSKETYDNANAEAPGVVPDPDYYGAHTWAQASVKDYADAVQLIQQTNRTKNAFMSVFSADAGNTDENTYGGEIANAPSVIVKGEKVWEDFENAFGTRQAIWLHIDATVGKVTRRDVLPPQQLVADTAKKQSVTWGDKNPYDAGQENVQVVAKLADIPLQDASGQRITYTQADDGSYPASNGITYWVNELVKTTPNGAVVQYTVRETLDAAGTMLVEKDKEAAGLVGYTASADEVAWSKMDKDLKTEVGQGADKVEVDTYRGELTNELALGDFTVVKIWDDAPATEHGDGDAAKLKDAYTLFENDVKVADSGNLKLQPAAAEPYVKTGDAEVGILETKNGTSTDGKVTTTFTWHNIPKYVGSAEGVRKAVYSVKETKLANYEAPVYGGDATDKALDQGSITNTQRPPTPVDDETWGLRGQQQTGTPSFEKGTADIETIQFIDPKTNKPTNAKTVDALDEHGDKIGTYTLNDNGTVTFKPNDDFVGDPAPAKLHATDGNGFTTDAKYQPHVVDDTETDTVSRTIHYIYSTDGSTAAPDVPQSTTFTRTATGLDPETHEPVWGDWKLTKSTLDDVESPEIEGWNPSSELVPGFDKLTYDQIDKVKDVTVVYSPNPPAGSHKTSFGPKGAVQTGTPPFTKGTGTIEKYELVDKDGKVVKKLPAYDADGKEVGSYTIDTETGKVTYTPDPDFVGTPTPATVRATDTLGETATGTYTPTSIENTEASTVTKTITHVYEDGSPVLDSKGNPLVTTQTLKFEREGTVNPDTGEITWPAWGKKTFEDWNAPDVAGYTPHKPKSTGETVTGDSDDITDEIVYKKDSYTVVYKNGSNGKSDGKGDQTGVPYGEKVRGGNTVTPDDGYKFTGTYTYTITKKDGTVETGKTDDPKSVVVTGNVVFTPLYEKLPEVTYIDPATGRVIQDWLPFNDDRTEPSAPGNPTRDGYDFDGWDREVDDDGNVTYKATWKPWKYTITYDANGGVGTMTDQKFTSDDSTAESKRNSFTRDGYDFVGFKAKGEDGKYLKDADGNDLLFSDPRDFMNYLREQGPDSKVTLVAQWVKKANLVPKPDPTKPNPTPTPTPTKPSPSTPSSTTPTKGSVPSTGDQAIPWALGLVAIAGLGVAVFARRRSR